MESAKHIIQVSVTFDHAFRGIYTGKQLQVEALSIFIKAFYVQLPSTLSNMSITKRKQPKNGSEGPKNKGGSEQPIISKHFI
jgi:hypothetical protein